MLLIGQRIKELRKEKNITQAELSKELNLSDRTVSKWEQGKGNPDIETLPDLSRFFGVSIDYLITGEDFKSDRNASNYEIVVNYFNKLIGPVKLNEYCERYIYRLSEEYKVSELKDAIDIFYERYLKGQKEDILAYIQNEIPKLSGIARSSRAEPQEREILHIIHILNKNDPENRRLNDETKKLIERHLDLRFSKDDADRIVWLKNLAKKLSENHTSSICINAALSKTLLDYRDKQRREKRIQKGFIDCKPYYFESIDSAILDLNQSIRDNKVGETFENVIYLLDLLIKKLTISYDSSLDESSIPHISKIIDNLYEIYGGYLGRDNSRVFKNYYDRFSMYTEKTKMPYKVLEYLSYFIDEMSSKIDKRMRGIKTSYKPNINLLMTFK